MSDSFFDAPTELAAAQAARTSAETIADVLKTSELSYRRLFETARDGILILDSAFGKITDANPFMSELLGYTHAELLGKELWEIGLLRDKDASQNAFQQLKTSGYIRYEDGEVQFEGVYPVGATDPDARCREYEARGIAPNRKLITGSSVGIDRL